MLSVIIPLYTFGKLRIPVSRGVYTIMSIHSEKFKMNEEVGSFLSEKVSNLLLT